MNETEIGALHFTWPALPTSREYLERIPKIPTECSEHVMEVDGRKAIKVRRKSKERIYEEISKCPNDVISLTTDVMNDLDEEDM